HGELPPPRMWGRTTAKRSGGGPSSRPLVVANGLPQTSPQGSGTLAKAIFSARVDSTYDDVLGMHYHFPHNTTYRYLATAEAAVGDWIIYYEPSRRNTQIRDGRSVYFATARVTSIRPDPGK